MMQRKIINQVVKPICNIFENPNQLSISHTLAFEKNIGVAGLTRRYYYSKVKSPYYSNYVTKYYLEVLDT